jgi:hypothetical protein
MWKKDVSKERRENAVNVTEMKSESPADCNGPDNQPQTEQHVHSATVNEGSAKLTGYVIFQLPNKFFCPVKYCRNNPTKSKVF